MDTNTVLGVQDIGGLRREVRARRRAVSLPLLLTGAAITAVSVRDVLWWYTTPTDRPWESGQHFLDQRPVQVAFWLLVPVAFLGLWWFRQRQRSEKGLGVTRPAVVAAGVVASLLLVAPAFLILLILGPFMAFCLGLLIVGVAERTTAVWAWALIVGIPGVLESFNFDNHLPLQFQFDGQQVVTKLVLACLTLAAGLASRWQEDRVLSTR